MRQLVSVVKDGHVNYILAEDDGTVDQIARIKVPESFSIEDTVTLGFGLVDAMHLNGTKRSGATRQPAIEKPAPAALPRAPKAKGKGKVGRPKGQPSYPVTRQQLIDHLRVHPGASAHEMAAVFLPDLDKWKGRQAIDNRLRPFMNMNPPQVSCVVDEHRVGHWYLTPAAPAPEGVIPP